MKVMMSSTVLDIGFLIQKQSGKSSNSILRPAVLKKSILKKKLIFLLNQTSTIFPNSNKYHRENFKRHLKVLKKMKLLQKKKFKLSLRKFLLMPMHQNLYLETQWKIRCKKSKNWGYLIEQVHKCLKDIVPNAAHQLPIICDPKILTAKQWMKHLVTFS